MTSKPDQRTQTIRELNDQFRETAIGGQILATSGVTALPAPLQAFIFSQVQTFAAFTPGNDPHGEHDFGSFTAEGQKVLWKIDYYAPDMMHGSEDPADPAVTRRVLTIMLAEEY